MCLDLCNYYTSASHLEDLALLPKKKLFLIHVNDVPRRPMEVLGCEHRTFPGQGRMDVPGLLTAILRRTRYDGYCSMELYDKDVWAMAAKDVFKQTDAGVKFVEKGLRKAARGR
jgi:sugar phosphate isomerase/epimerase